MSVGGKYEVLISRSSLEADILCEGHYGVFTGREDVADFIRSFLQPAAPA
jgi:hypothetical protein